MSDHSVPVDFLDAFQIMTWFCSYKERKATSQKFLGKTFQIGLLQASLVVSF